jgi:hypothetical protein
MLLLESVSFFAFFLELSNIPTELNIDADDYKNEEINQT